MLYPVEWGGEEPVADIVQLLRWVAIPTPRRAAFYNEAVLRFIHPAKGVEIKSRMKYQINGAQILTAWFNTVTNLDWKKNTIKKELGY